jgi:hypothetical protein
MVESLSLSTYASHDWFQARRPDVGLGEGEASMYMELKEQSATLKRENDELNAKIVLLVGQLRELVSGRPAPSVSDLA